MVLLHYSDNQAIAYILLVPLFVTAIAFEFGPGPIPWMMATEYTPTKYLSAIQSLGTTFNWFNVFVSMLIFPLLEEKIGPWVFSIFVANCALATIYMRFWAVESKGKTNEEILREFSSQGCCSR